MAFVPSDDRAPRRLARELRFELSLRSVAIDADAALEAVAALYGHPSHAALRTRIRRGTPSLPDDLADPATVEARRAHQAATLAGLGLAPADVPEVLDVLRPSARPHAKGPGSRSLLCLLDVPQDLCAPIGTEHLELMAALLQREGAMDVRSGPAGVGEGAFDLFLRTVPENVRAVARHFREGRHEVTFGVTVLLGRMSRSHEEAALWVATLQEMWRRLGKGTIRIGHFAEAFACGVPTEAAVADVWARRRAGETSANVPRYPHAVPEGAVGFMLSRAGAAPRVVLVPDFESGGFMARHARMLDGAPGDPAADAEANLGLCAELVRELDGLPEGHPEAARAMGLLLWLALVNPRGDGRGLAEVSRGDRRHVTMTLSRDHRIRTSVSDAFEDRTRMMYA